MSVDVRNPNVTQTGQSDQWTQRAAEHGRMFQCAYSWPETQIINDTDKIVAYEPNLSYGFTMAAAQVKRFVFPRLDISEEYQIDRRMVVDVQLGEEYLLVCDEGDMWEFKGSQGRQDQCAVINVLTHALVDNGESYQLSEYPFQKVIPFNYRVHFLCKASKEYIIRALPDDEKLQQLIQTRFARPRFVPEANLKEIRPTTYHEFKRHSNSPSIKIKVAGPTPNHVPNCYPFSVVLLYIA